MRILCAVFKLFLFLLLVLLTVLVQPLVLLVTKGPVAYLYPQFFHWAACRIFNIKLRLVGDAPQVGQILYLSNHLSYLDIPVLGSLIRGSFIAKADVEGWALFGFLSQLQQTAFIKRDRNAAKTVQAQINSMVAQGKSLILFPEGTSTDGRSVYPFKSSLFSLFVGDHAPKDLQIQPITLRMHSTDGVVLAADDTQDRRDIYAWHVGMDDSIDIGTHLWAFAKSKGAVIEVIFHPLLTASAYDDRKILTHAAYQAVSGGLS